jgi:hypothetical protein
MPEAFYIYNAVQLKRSSIKSAAVKVNLRYNQDSYLKRHVAILPIISNKFYGGTM